MIKQIVFGAVAAATLASSAFAAADIAKPTHRDFEKFDKEVKKLEQLCGITSIAFTGTIGSIACLSKMEHIMKAGYSKRVIKEWGATKPFKTARDESIFGAVTLPNPLSWGLSTSASGRVNQQRKNFREHFGMRFNNGNLIEWNPDKIEMAWDNKATHIHNASPWMRDMIREGRVQVVN